jgi:hypothetical protein
MPDLGVNIISDLGELKQYLLSGDSSITKPLRAEMNDLAVGSQFWETDTDAMFYFSTNLTWEAK